MAKSGDEEIAPSEVITDGGGDYKEELIATLKSLSAAGFERFVSGSCANLVSSKS